MNADELADYLHEFMFNEVDYDEDKHNQSQLMLRQQQAEIDSLYYENSMLKNRRRLQNSTIAALKEQIKEKDVCLKILMQRLDDGN